MEWTVSVVVDAPVERALAAVGDLHAVTAWSSPPKKDGDTVVIEGDGVSVGSVLVHRDVDGVERGRQELTAVGADRVQYLITTQGPGGRTMAATGVFRVRRHDAAHSEVLLDFRLDLSLPFPLRRLAERAIGAQGRAQQIEELGRLRAYIETDPAERPHG